MKTKVVKPSQQSRTHKAMVEISTMSVTDPNAVKSTAITVSQGVRAFAKAIRMTVHAGHLVLQQFRSDLDKKAKSQRGHPQPPRDLCGAGCRWRLGKTPNPAAETNMKSFPLNTDCGSPKSFQGPRNESEK
jgi:hypothetical protein